MALSTTVKQLRTLLESLTEDLEKGALGNKAAAQRVRTGTIRLEKIAKTFRKESILAEKKGTLKRTPAPKKKAAAKKTTVKTVKKAAPKKVATKKAAPKKKAVTKASTTVKKTTAGKKTAATKKAPATKKAAATKKAPATKKATTRARSRALTLRKATAKLPARRRAR